MSGVLGCKARSCGAVQAACRCSSIHAASRCACPCQCSCCVTHAGCSGVQRASGLPQLLALDPKARRLTLPLCPALSRSASNYVLGLSPLPLPPFLAGTAVGMAFWSLFYASLGGASRSLLLRGVDPELLVADMMDKAGQYTRELGAAAVVLAAGALLYAGTGLVRRRFGGADGERSDASSGASEDFSSSSSNGTTNDNDGDSEAAVPSGRDRAAQQLSGEFGRELGRSAAMGKELEMAGLRLKGWLGGSAGVGTGSTPPAHKQEQLVESHLKD